MSCGEENLLNLAGDPYPTENILVHELAHAIHEMALTSLDSTFDHRLQEAYAAARAAGRWANTYAMDNHREYWAEGAQSWFDTNRRNDDQHGPIATRADLLNYDPPLANLLSEAFAWPSTSDAPPSGSSSSAVSLQQAPMGPSPSSTQATQLEVENHRAKSVVVEWIDSLGRPVVYATVAPGQRQVQSTYVGHVWRIRENDTVLGFVAAPAGASHVDVR